MAENATPDRQASEGPSEAEVVEALDSLVTRPEANLIGALQEIQGRFGYLPPPVLEAMSRRSGIPLSRIYGVVTFYAQFYTEPRGRHTILCCRGTACHVKGAGRVLEAVERELDIEEGESTPDLMFYLETVACLGTCFLAPVMMIDNEYYGMMTPQKVAAILQNFRAQRQ
jgi:NADH-quinone oxidoreductase subunit E